MQSHLNESVKGEAENYQIEAFVTNLEVPWDMVFTSEKRMLITERPGRVRVVENGILKAEPLLKLSNVYTEYEDGLMSIELDPNYEENKWVYLSWTPQIGKGVGLKIARFTDTGDQLTEEKVIFENLPAAIMHSGSRIRFGPDEKLYITLGDALKRKQAQNLEVFNGKILRINKDGSIPEDNPFANSPIWSYGHRNPQGIAWNPETGELFESERGPSVFDGPAGGDEINHIVKGGNYGWPLVSHDEKREGTIAPLIQFTPAQPPGSLLVYSGKLFPEFKNNLFFGSLAGEGLIRITLDENDPNKISTWEKMENINLGRIRNVIEGPDGSIYFSTSNRDGRGNPTEKDDQIFRMKL